MPTKGEGLTTQKLTPPGNDPVYRCVVRHGFEFARAEQDGDIVAYGYVHKDGRAVLHTYGLGWEVRQPDGCEQGGRDLKVLDKLLTNSRKAVIVKKQEKNRALHKVHKHEVNEAKIQAAPDKGWVSVLRLVCDATEGTFQLRKKLQGESNYGTRLKIAKKLLGDTEARVADAAITALTKRLYVQSRVKEAAPAVMEKEFADNSKATLEAADAAEAAEAEEWREAKKKGLAATRLERTVAGPIIEPPKRKHNAAAKAREEKEALKAELEAKKLRKKSGEQGEVAPETAETVEDKPMARAVPLTAEQPGKLMERVTGWKSQDGQLATLKEGEDTAELHPERHAASDYLVPSECTILEHVDTGVCLLRLAKPGLYGGAPCVYNNAKEVNVGIVHLTRLYKFREIEKADVQTAARQLLSPITRAVISPDAQRHLTAVLNCKELTAMTAEETTTAEKPAKFAAPKKTAKKGAAKKTAKKGAAEKKGASEKKSRAPRVGSYAGKKIKVLNKDHGAREGSLRAKGLDILIKSKTTDDAIPLLQKAGCNNSFIAFAVNQGFIELV